MLEHEINVGTLSINSNSFNKVLATFISYKGLSLKETLIVLPIP